MSQVGPADLSAVEQKALDASNAAREKQEQAGETQVRPTRRINWSDSTSVVTASLAVHVETDAAGCNHYHSSAVG